MPRRRAHVVSAARASSQCTGTADSAACVGVEQLSAATHEWTKGEFGAAPLTFFQQISKCVQAGHLISVEGRPLRLRSPADARRAGIAMLSEDRKGSGLLFNFALSQNVTIGNLGGIANMGFVDRRAERLDRVERGRGVLRSEVVAHGDRLVRHRGEQGGAVRDRLVGRRDDRPAQPARRGEQRAPH